MRSWHFTRNGLREDPVDFDTLRGLARDGRLDPARDLVWSHPMKDWAPAGSIDGLFAAPSDPPMPTTDAAGPVIEFGPVAGLDGDRVISVADCLKRGLAITLQHFGLILLVGLLFLGISIGAGLLLDPQDPEAAPRDAVDALRRVASHFLSVWLALGLTRIGLNLVDGGRVSPMMLFGEWDKLAKAFVASLLLALICGAGLLLLVVPGIYLLLRFGQFMAAMVDRDLGIRASFARSSEITRGNRLRLLLLVLASLVVLLAGLLALGIGLVLAWPVVWISWLVAYRWMDRGRAAAMGVAS
jgi:hypothetical protein